MRATADGPRPCATSLTELTRDPPVFYEKGETVVVTCELVTRIRVTGNELRLPMVQVVTVQSGKIIEFRPFYWNVPEYVAAANEGSGQ